VATPLPSSLNRGEVISIPSAFQLVGVFFAALLGLAFGSFLNVVVSRFPEGESIATPRSHCRNCTHTLSWWENLPVLSWLLLRGRCRQCHTRISLRYPLIELAIGLLWAAVWLKFSRPLFSSTDFAELEIPHLFIHAWIELAGGALLTWLLIALAALDAEFLWLPDWLTLSGIAMGFSYTLSINRTTRFFDNPVSLSHAVEICAIAILASAALILAIRLAYWLIRRKEGMGLGDAKLMAMLGAWLGLRGALESFALAIFGALIAAVVWLAILTIRRKSSEWAKMPLPLGTFLCLGALTEIFYPNWLWTAWVHTIFNY
jgi:leader peptidase (prepilin peptidase) / N-methyltransferase